MNDPLDPVELSPSRAELIARVRTRGRQIRARRRLGIASITALVVVGIAAPAIAIGTRSSTTSTIPPAVSTTAPPNTAAPNGDLTATIELASNTIVTGHEGQGAVIITNHTDHPIPLDTPRDCAGKWAVALTSPSASQHPVWTLEGCTLGRSRTLLPGANRFPFTLATTYNGCAKDNTVGSGPDVLCESNPAEGVRLLPPGDYDAALVTSQPGYLPPAPRVPVHVIAARTDLTARIELPGDELVGGTEVRGTLVIENHTGGPVTIEPAGACRGKWTVTFTSSDLPPAAAFEDDCGTGRTVVAPGTSRLAFTVSTTTISCSNTDPVPAGHVKCLPGGARPPFPPGVYDVVVADTFDGWFPKAPPVRVRIVGGLR